MNGFVQVIIDLMTNVGVNPSEIYARNRKTLPGFYRPTKAWDLLVVREKALLAAVEMKSHVGSFGNNFNNRVVEAIGDAEDIWDAYRAGAFKASPQPWVGFVMVLQDTPAVHRPRQFRQPHFSVLPEFRLDGTTGVSYTEAYELFCRKLVLQRKYSAACFITTDRDQHLQIPNYSEPAEDLSVNQFLDSMLRHVTP